MAHISRMECKRCLLSEMSDQQYYNTIREYIDSIDLINKVEEKMYKKRLNQCKICEYLLNGMCRLCGCFVEIRAVKKGNRCADTPEKW